MARTFSIRTRKVIDTFRYVPNNLISILSHGLKVQIFSPRYEYALVEQPYFTAL